MFGSARRTWVLGGGGARGAAQVGVLQALFEANVEPPAAVVATDLNAGKPAVFRSGELTPALLASTAIPGVFPMVRINEREHLDGGIVANTPLSIAVDDGAKEILAVSLMAGGEHEQAPAGFGELIARTLQLSLHHQM